MMPNDVQAIIAKVIFFMISFTMLCMVKARAEVTFDQNHFEQTLKGKVGVVRNLE